MKQFLSGRMLRVALAVLAISTLSVPASAQIQVEVSVGPFDVRFAPDAPPPMRREYRTARPEPGYIWIGGYWDLDGDRWAWRRGRWDRPESRDVRWIRPVYRGEGGGYRYEPGHYSNQRVVEGEDYRRARAEHHGKRGNSGRHGNGNASRHGNGHGQHPGD